MSAEVQLRVTLQRQLDVAQTHLATLNDKLAYKQAELRAAHAELRCEAPQPVCDLPQGWGGSVKILPRGWEEGVIFGASHNAT